MKHSEDNFGKIQEIWFIMQEDVLKQLAWKLNFVIVLRLMLPLLEFYSIQFLH